MEMASSTEINADEHKLTGITFLAAGFAGAFAAGFAGALAAGAAFRIHGNQRIFGLTIWVNVYEAIPSGI
jgi:hypothetical protein